jgi:hypothetical protein
MSSVEVFALEGVAIWLCSGRLSIRATDDGLDDIREHVVVLESFRSCRRWSGLISMRLLASVHMGRSSWARRNLRISTETRTTLVAAHRIQDAMTRREIDDLQDRVQDAERELAEMTEELAQRDREYEDLRVRFIDMMDHAQGLEIELQVLRASRN